MSIRSWIDGDESASQMLARVLGDRPLLLLPPLHRVPLRVGNVVEIVGPSPSAKTQILLQAIINCILPKEWKNVHYGGLERLVMYIDLDCRFDILRLSQLLKHNITMAFGSKNRINQGQHEDNFTSFVAQTIHIDEELFESCMSRFLYIRCYSSFELLASLKTMQSRFEKEISAHGVPVHFLMIDSIGAFYWVDRATKPLILEDKHRTSGKWMAWDTLDARTSNRSLEQMYREYMPLAWKSFVTHRILLRPSDECFSESEHLELPIYIAEWVLPSLNFSDKFTVTNTGITMVT